MKTNLVNMKQLTKQVGLKPPVGFFNYCEIAYLRENSGNN